MNYRELYDEVVKRKRLLESHHIDTKILEPFLQAIKAQNPEAKIENEDKVKETLALWDKTYNS